MAALGMAPSRYATATSKILHKYITKGTWWPIPRLSIQYEFIVSTLCFAIACMKEKNKKKGGVRLPPLAVTLREAG